jgi:hypothetical protein
MLTCGSVEQVCQGTVAIQRRRRHAVVGRMIQSVLRFVFKSRLLSLKLAIIDIFNLNFHLNSRSDKCQSQSSAHSINNLAHNLLNYYTLLPSKSRSSATIHQNAVHY